jgi:hypothetical protein
MTRHRRSHHHDPDPAEIPRAYGPHRCCRAQTSPPTVPVQVTLEAILPDTDGLNIVRDLRNVTRAPLLMVAGSYLSDVLQPPMNSKVWLPGASVYLGPNGTGVFACPGPNLRPSADSLQRYTLGLSLDGRQRKRTAPQMKISPGQKMPGGIRNHWLGEFVNPHARGYYEL